MGYVHCFKCGEIVDTVATKSNHTTVCPKCASAMVEEMTLDELIAHAKVGMTSVIDEATGKQDTRPPDELRKSLNKYRGEK